MHCRGWDSKKGSKETKFTNQQPALNRFYLKHILFGVFFFLVLPPLDFFASDLTRVLRVDDDYSLVVIYHGQRERVRLIGVDRQQEDTAAKPARYYRKGVREFLKKTLQGKNVLVIPENNRRDMYGRLLAYIHLPPDQVEEPLPCLVGTADLAIDVNASLISCGYARVDTRLPFQRMERYAEVEKDRIERERKAEEEAIRKAEEERKKKELEENFKYVASRKGQRFHKPDCRYAKKIPPEDLVKFLTREEAIEEAYLPCGLCDP